MWKRDYQFLLSTPPKNYNYEGNPLRVALGIEALRITAHPDRGTTDRDDTENKDGLSEDSSPCTESPRDTPSIYDEITEDEVGEEDDDLSEDGGCYIDVRILSFDRKSGEISATVVENTSGHMLGTMTLRMKIDPEDDHYYGICEIKEIKGIIFKK